VGNITEAPDCPSNGLDHLQDDDTVAKCMNYIAYVYPQLYQFRFTVRSTTLPNRPFRPILDDPRVPQHFGQGDSSFGVILEELHLHVRKK